MSLQPFAYRTTTDEAGIEYGWLSGLTYKLEEDPKPSEWMVSPAVEKAIEVARRLSEPLRQKVKEQIRLLEFRLQQHLDASERLEINQILHDLRTN